MQYQEHDQDVQDGIVSITSVLRFEFEVPAKVKSPMPKGHTWYLN